MRCSKHGGWHVARGDADSLSFPTVSTSLESLSAQSSTAPKIYAGERLRLLGKYYFRCLLFPRAHDPMMLARPPAAQHALPRRSSDSFPLRRDV